jgi:hypothetical protein
MTICHVAGYDKLTVPISPKPLETMIHRPHW